jgi:hypothetical protein
VAPLLVYFIGTQIDVGGNPLTGISGIDRIVEENRTTD